jgi:endonuclease-3
MPICELHHEWPVQLAVATLLSTQTADVRVNMVAPALFEALPHAIAPTGALQRGVDELIRSTGCFATISEKSLDSRVDRHLCRSSEA